MKFTKEDKRDLLKLADIIEKKEFFNKKERPSGNYSFNLPKDKRDGSQFNLGQYYFDCGMPACAAGHAVCEFPKRFNNLGVKRTDSMVFAEAFNLGYQDAFEITIPTRYHSNNPKPKTVANRIRMIVKKQETTNA